MQGFFGAGQTQPASLFSFDGIALLIIALYLVVCFLNDDYQRL